MISSTTATARSSVPSSPPKRFYKGGHRNGALPPGYAHQFSEKVPKAKGGKPLRVHQPYHKRPNNDHPKHNELLDRMSLPSSSPSGTLLERIGGSVEDVDEVASTLTDSDRIIDGERVSEGADLPFSTTPHYYTPEPGEVERFLESVIGAPPAPPSPGSPAGPGFVHACLGNKPTLALDTHNLLVDHPKAVEDSSSSVQYSPTQTAVNSLPSATLTLDHYQQSPLEDTMPPPSTSAIEECRKRLVPVLLASAQARDPGKPLDAEQCLRLLSDDHCRHFFRQAKEMRLQLSSLVSREASVDRGWSGSLKRARVVDEDAWVRNTRSKLDSVNGVVSEVSRRDSDGTLVDFTGGKSLPEAPRAMLQASQASLSTASATPLNELVHQVTKMFPMLMPPVTETDTSNVPVGQPTGDQSEHPTQVASPTHTVSPSSTDFVSHLPTQPGTWFRQQGRRHAEIVDIDIEMSDEMFYMSRERRPFRLRMHLRLCSVPVGATTENNSGDTPDSLRDVDRVMEDHAHHWPKKGKLVVQVNPEFDRSKTWLPYTLESDPLDVTSCMRPGKNTFRFIQLSDLSEFTFVLTASPPPPKEEWRSWDWASLVERSRTRSSSSTDDPHMNGLSELSEFAHLPITVRS